jgi:hypothetical protein
MIRLGEEKRKAVFCRGESMRPLFRLGDRIHFAPCRIEDVRQGDVIIFTSPGQAERVIHRVVSTVPVKKIMERFNLAWKDDTAIDSSLDLVDAFPVKTPWGLLTREELRDAIFSGKEGSPNGAGPLSQTFGFLDGSHALCTEKWPNGGTSRGIVRWTFLLKKKNDWRIDYVSQNAMADAP